MAEEKKSALKETAKFAVKIAVSAIALYFVFRKVDFDETWRTMTQANLLFLILALIIFNISKLISIFRLKYLLADISIYIDNLFNVKLYYIGAFYNLFLPGSVGGDGYKIYLLKQRYDGETRRIISAVFLDRLSGLVSLFFLTGFLLLFSTYDHTNWFLIIVITAIVLAFPAYWIFLRLFFKRFTDSYFSTNYVSLATQALQVASAFFILLGLNAAGSSMDYLSLFMVSSVVAVVPFTIGGLGAREVVFVLGYQYLNIDKHTAIAFTLLFFAITAISSFIGFFLSFEKIKRAGAVI